MDDYISNLWLLDSPDTAENLTAANQTIPARAAPAVYRKYPPLTAALFTATEGLHVPFLARLPDNLQEPAPTEKVTLQAFLQGRRHTDSPCALLHKWCGGVLLMAGRNDFIRDEQARLPLSLIRLARTAAEKHTDHLVKPEELAPIAQRMRHDSYAWCGEESAFFSSFADFRSLLLRLGSLEVLNRLRTDFGAPFSEWRDTLQSIPQAQMQAIVRAQPARLRLRESSGKDKETVYTAITLEGLDRSGQAVAKAGFLIRPFTENLTEYIVVDKEGNHP